MKSSRLTFCIFCVAGMNGSPMASVLTTDIMSKYILVTLLKFPNNVAMLHLVIFVSPASNHFYIKKIPRLIS